MVEGLPDMEGWGLLAMTKEAVRLLHKYARLLLPFLVAFLLPEAIILYVGVACLPDWSGRHGPPHRFGGMLDHHRHHPHFSFNAFSKAPPLPPIVLYELLLVYALVVVVWLLVSLALASIAKAVQYIYSDDEDDPDIVKSIFKSLPAAFFRIFVTSLWIFLLDLFFAFLVSLPFVLLSAAHVNPKLLDSVRLAFLFVALLLVDFFCLITLQVAVLEPENYGLAALTRSVKLVQTKTLTALALFALYLVFTLADVVFFDIPAQIPGTGQLPPWLWYVLAVAMPLLYWAILAYLLVLMSVFYFASKAESGAEEQVQPEANSYQPLAGSAENVEARTRSATA